MTFFTRAIFVYPNPSSSSRRLASSMKISRVHFDSWLFSPDRDVWLTLLRIGLGVQVVAYCWLQGGGWNSFLSRGNAGVLDRRLPEILVSRQSLFVPQVDWLVRAADQVGLSEEQTLRLVWILLLTAALFIIAGLFSRAFSVIAWFLHLAVAKSGGLFSYGVDNFMTIGLFYLMVSPLPDRLALDARLWKTRSPDPMRLGFFRRLLQVHLCVVYFFGGLTKSLGAGWWDGSNLWRAVTRPPFGIISPDWLAHFSGALVTGGIAVCVIELAYPVFIWPEKTRRLWLILICIMHASIGILMGMYLFALVMIVLNLAAFGPGQPQPQLAPLPLPNER
jgi:uncharacterized membrane protein YphA (DoxX/SURF4 family)